LDIGKRVGRYFGGRRLEGAGEAGGRADAHVREISPAGDVGTAIATLEHEPGSAETRGDDERIGEMDEERLQILRMVEERKITAGEAAKLLSALDSQPDRPAEPQSATRARWLRVRVTDGATGRPKVNVNVPVSAVLALGKLGNRFGGSFLEKEGIDLEGLIEAIRSGAEGKIVDVSDENSRDHVEVVIE
jgi:hypothetical protein